MIFPLSNGFLSYIYKRIKGQTFNQNQKKPNKMSKIEKIIQSQLNDEAKREGKEIKYILDILNDDARTMQGIKNLCGRRHKRMFGYEISNKVVEHHVALLLELGMIEIKKEQGGDGWNTSYEYEVFALKQINSWNTSIDAIK